jgi:hypothetical protein
MTFVAIWTAIRAGSAVALKNWKAVVLLLLAAFCAAQGLRLRHANADLARARAALIDPATHKPWREEYETCQTNGQVLNAALDRQNAAVAALQTESDARRTTAATAERQAQAQATAFRHDAQTIAQAKPSGTACDQADKLILEAQDGE